jgi:NADH-quinone oxidoreductase subunit C
MINFSLKFLYSLLNHKIESIYYSCTEVIIKVDSTKLKDVIIFLKNHESCLFQLLIDITVIDYPQKQKRFDVVYNLCSVKYNCRIKVLTSVDELTPVSSISDIYKAANWMEREVWDMYGIYIESHPDLRRILTDYGFEGYPLRKDFPLSGFKEVRYDDSQKRVVFEAVELSQEFRVYNFINPWESKEPPISLK